MSAKVLMDFSIENSLFFDLKKLHFFILRRETGHLLWQRHTNAVLERWRKIIENNGDYLVEWINCFFFVIKLLWSIFLSRNPPKLLRSLSDLEVSHMTIFYWIFLPYSKCIGCDASGFWSVNPMEWDGSRAITVSRCHPVTLCTSSTLYLLVNRTLIEFILSVMKETQY